MKVLIGSLAKQVFALAPFAMVLGVGFSTRTWRPTVFKSFEYSHSEDALVKAYGHLEGKIEGLLTRNPTNSQIRTILQAWSRGYEDGSLKPLLPAFEEEEAENGPRTQILMSWVNTLNLGKRIELQDLANGQIDSWKADTKNLINTIEAFKYSDSNTLQAGDILEKSLLTDIRKQCRLHPELLKTFGEPCAKLMCTDIHKFMYLRRTLLLNAADYVKRQRDIEYREGYVDGDGQPLDPDWTDPVAVLNSGAQEAVDCALSAQNALKAQVKSFSVEPLFMQ